MKYAINMRNYLKNQMNYVHQGQDGILNTLLKFGHYALEK